MSHTKALALLDAARRVTLAALCLTPISLFAVALPFKVYEHFHGSMSALINVVDALRQ
jgi:hypothetical protein